MKDPPTEVAFQDTFESIQLPRRAQRVTKRERRGALPSAPLFRWRLYILTSLALAKANRSTIPIIRVHATRWGRKHRPKKRPFLIMVAECFCAFGENENDHQNVQNDFT